MPFLYPRRLIPGPPQIPKSKDGQVPYNAFFPNIFDLWLVESNDVEPMDMEVWLYIGLLDGVLYWSQTAISSAVAGPALVFLIITIGKLWNDTGLLQDLEITQQVFRQREHISLGFRFYWGWGWWPRVLQADSILLNLKHNSGNLKCWKRKQVAHIVIKINHDL